MGGAGRDDKAVADVTQLGRCDIQSEWVLLEVWGDTLRAVWEKVRSHGEMRACAPAERACQGLRGRCVLSLVPERLPWPTPTLKGPWEAPSLQDTWG